MASGISFSGLSTGIDTDSIISALTQVETARRTTLQGKQNALKLRQTAYTALRSSMTAVSRAAGALNSPGSFATIKASSSDDAVATVAATSSAAVGSFDLDVEQLAKANKLGSAAQADVTTALGKAGTASVNGKAVKIEATDSLAGIAKKINALGSGTTASVVDGGAGRAYLTLSAGSTGATSSVQLADLDGSAFKDLGLIGAGATVREASGTTAIGSAFGSKSTPLQSLLGATGLGASTITVGGATLGVDPATDTLDDLATKINAAGGSATVQADTKNGATVYRLQISGGAAISESGGILRGIGILKSDAANELVPGQDAKFTLDGVELTSATNAVTGAISGATLTLKKADEATIDLTKDAAAVKKNVQGLVSSVNDMLAAIAAQSAFDTKTYSSGVLFGDGVARGAKDAVRGLLFTDSPGIAGTLKNLASVGVGLDKDGNVTLDDAAFDAAIDANPEGVAALFQAVGMGSGSVKYVSATNAAKASSAAGYGVSVTQAATRGGLVAGKAQTGTRAVAETLTFRGSGFGASGIAVEIEAGTGLAATVAKINADGRLKDLVVASVEGGRLRIDAKRYGAAGNFTLASNAESTADNSGVGVGGEGTATLGVDVAGTIDGEAATGNGQFLTGNVGNAKTEGLQVQIVGTATGAVGALGYSRGVGSRMLDLVSGFTDSVKGSLAAADKGLQTQIDSLDADMTAVDNRLTSKKAELARRFAAMEDAIAKIKAKGTSLSSLINTNSNN